MHTPERRVVLGLHRSRHHRDILTAALDLGVTALDTASTYLHRHSHTTLAATAGNLLPKFVVSTKVGYFDNGHSLDPIRLQAAVEQTVRELGREPDTVLLHNPEHSRPDAQALAQACGVLADAVAAGLCGSWGISTWDPRPLVGLDAVPTVLMVRAGLLVGVDVLEAAEALVTGWRPRHVWGMSPFGGSTSKPVWEMFDVAMFLGNSPPASPVQAAFRAAFNLPVVEAVAVGTGTPEHLQELVDATEFDVDDSMVREYRQLLRQAA